ncbi:MAG TPA: AraC family transcriptional regulator [Candidatus Angelobacter sp.]|nr:AraC family transcriptional regulator [Candidatus Angelobacter sp.]
MLSQAKSAHNTDPRITFATRFLINNFASRDVLLKVALRLNLSSSRFRHLFKREMSVSPARYLKEVRLQQAKYLLETSALSVKEVMAAVGMSDFSHFVRDFKEMYGLSPLNLRRASWLDRVNDRFVTTKVANR